MTILRKVTGLCFNRSTAPTKNKMEVRITADGLGKTISIADTKNDIMLAIPIEPIKKDLLNTMGWEKK